jgi:hypothetical protein
VPDHPTQRTLSFEHLAGLWEDGERRIHAAEPAERQVYERVVTEILLDLRRRLGGKFSVDELTAYYLDNGTDWCYELAYRTAPGSPEAWDMSVVAGAAFSRYAHRAVDYGGGQRRGEDEEAG